MARGGMPPRPAGGAGRPPPPRRTGQQRPPAGGQRGQQAAPQQPQRSPGAEQQRRAAEQQRRAAEQQRRAAATRTNQQQRLRQQQYLREAHGARRQGEAEQRTAEVRTRVAQLESILAEGLSRSARIDLDSLHRTAERPPFPAGPLATPAPEPAWEDFAPGLLAGLGGRARRERQEAAARAEFERARQEWEAAEQQRRERLAAAERAHEQELAQRDAEVEQYHARIARVAAGLRDRDSAAVESFLRTVLRRVPLPPGFPRRFEVTHDRFEEKAALRVVLPGRDVVPAVSGYEYTTPADEVYAVARPPDAIDDLYHLVIAQVALLVVRDVLEADPGLDSVSFQGLVDRLHPASGEPDLACLLRFETARKDFEQLELDQLAPEESLDRLGAALSLDPVDHPPGRP